MQITMREKHKQNSSISKQKKTRKNAEFLFSILKIT